MKKKILFLIILSLAAGTFSWAQNAVVKHISEIGPAEIPGMQPDVAGMVLFEKNYLETQTSDGLILNSGITLHTGWPVSYIGSSSRGGIYCNLDADDDLEVVYCVTQQVYAWNLDGSVVDGWPNSVLQYPDGAPAFGDVDGDGEGDIVVSSRAAGTGNSGTLTAFHQDGSLLDGFPVGMTGGATKTPVLADLNGDGVYEIIVEERSWPDGYVGVYSGDGTTYPGFPVTLDYIPASAVAVGDITGDNIPEIVAESYYSIYAFDTEGNVLEGFPFTPGSERVFSYSSPVLADIDGDGFREILAGDHSTTSGNGAVHVLKNDGSPLEGWPQYVSYWIYGPPAVGDIDGDGSLDVAVGDQVLAGVPSNKVYAWDQSGNDLSGWPTDPMNAINNQIILADLDGDDQVELMWDDNTGDNVYIGYNHDGTPMEGWPLALNGSSFFMNPFVVDINNDGILDISGASGNLINNNLDFYLWNADVSMNPAHSPLTILQYNVRHDGTYIDASLLNAGFSASAVEVCKESEVQFSDQSTGNVTTWDWSFEGGYPSNSVEPNPIIYYADAGEYDVTLTVSDGTNSSTTTIEDYMAVGYPAVVPDQPNGPANFSTDTANITYYETWAPNAADYIWELVPDDVGVIVPGDTLTQIKVYWSSDPDYSAELKVKAVNICGESEFSESLTIYVNWSVGIASAMQKKMFQLFPNPSKGEIRVDFQGLSEAGQVWIYNNRGETTRAFDVNFSEDPLTIKHLFPGIYFLRLEAGGNMHTEKFIVR